MVGLPGQKLIDPRFQQNWQPTIRATMRSTGRLMRLGNPQGVRNTDTNIIDYPAPWPVYEGPCRVQIRGSVTTARAGGPTVTVADRTITVGAYLFATPADATPGVVGGTVEILTCPDDPALEGVTLHIVQVGHADIAFQRNYGCDVYSPTIRG